MEQPKSIGYLGPEYSFSYCLAIKEFPKATLVRYDDFNDACSAILSKGCEAALIPFYNTNGHDVVEAQKVILKYREKIFVNGVFADDIEHHACGFGEISEIREVFSKQPVLKQISRWMNDPFRKNARFIPVDSTSKAVEMVSKTKDPHQCAVGSVQAAKHFRVPVLEAEIQNKPNITVFFLLSETRPEFKEIASCVWAVENCQISDMNKMENIAEEYHCSITAASRYTVEGTKYAYFEITAFNANLNMLSLCNQISAGFKTASFLGGYKKNSIKTLIR